MGTPTYTPLANITLGSTATTVTFSSISGLYRDLVLVAQYKHTAGYYDVLVRFNSDSGANYNTVRAGGSGSSAQSSSLSASTAIYTGYLAVANATDALSFNMNIMDYSATDKHKSVLHRDDASGTGTDMQAHRWASTSAITSITITTGTSGLASGSTFALYGVAA